MSTTPVTYSFKSVSGAFTHPLAGDFQFAGQIGMGEFVVVMSTERSTHDVASDGTVMVSYIAGDNGALDIQVQQTSDLHQFLLDWFNQIKTLADQGDPTNWATASITLRSLTDGAQHKFIGVSPTKPPDKTYASQGGKLTWRLMAADVQNIVPGA